MAKPRKKAAKRKAKKSAKRTTRRRARGEIRAVKLVPMTNPPSAERKINDAIKAGWHFYGMASDRGAVMMLALFEGDPDPEPDDEPEAEG
jgi:hypothetical protein